MHLHSIFLTLVAGVKSASLPVRDLDPACRSIKAYETSLSLASNQEQPTVLNFPAYGVRSTGPCFLVAMFTSDEVRQASNAGVGSIGIYKTGASLGAFISSEEPQYIELSCDQIEYELEPRLPPDLPSHAPDAPVVSLSFVTSDENGVFMQVGHCEDRK
ncbi:hypothetical protein F5Y15DRAFT_371415 [Xylariaceae sp. FL0016]|nr:hypothetical protein F5Y15DRAFT_371415 [Xylariaceae sp. FL0016]